MAATFAFGINVVSFLVTGAILLLLVISVDFTPHSIRYNYPNESTPDDSLAVHMTVHQAMNYLMPFPSPHINVTDEELNRLWRLPPTTKISPAMEAIARCHIAMERKYPTSSKTICNRIKVTWPWIVLVVALINCGQFLSGVTVKNTTGWATDSPTERRKKTWCGAFYAMIGSASWFFTVFVTFVVFEAKVDVDHGPMLLYTLHGQVHPEVYYSMPIIWGIVLILCLFNYLLKTVEIGCFICASRQKAVSACTKKTKSKMDEETKKRWKLAEKRFFKNFNNSGVPKKTLKNVVKYCKTEFSSPLSYLLLEETTPFSPIFTDAIKKFGSDKSKK